MAIFCVMGVSISGVAELYHRNRKELWAYQGETEVTAVAGELRQDFSNLLVNSLDAIDEGGTIMLRVMAREHCVRVSVADNGRGIGALERKHIFEPFFTTKGTTGSGLGLWISAQLIQKQGGMIQAHSKVNYGTVVSVVLRLRAGVQGEIAA